AEFRYRGAVRRRKQQYFGGDERDRTVGLLSAIQALSQLSYIPIATGRVSVDRGRHSTEGDRLCNRGLLKIARGQAGPGRSGARRAGARALAGEGACAHPGGRGARGG